MEGRGGDQDGVAGGVEREVAGEPWLACSKSSSQGTGTRGVSEGGTGPKGTAPWHAQSLVCCAVWLEEPRGGGGRGGRRNAGRAS